MLGQNSETAETSDEDSGEEEDVSSPEEEIGVANYEANAPDPYLRISRAPFVKPSCRLNTLSLRGYPKVTDFALQYLKDVSLKLLDVSYTNVTAKGVIDFMTMHPNCRVIHESACTCGPRIHF